MKQNEPTKKQALKIARILGCEGAHKNGNGWMPCLSNEEYVAIKKGKEEYLKVRATIKLPPQIKIVNRTQRLETKSDAYYESRSDAVNISKLRGCGGVRTVVLDGKKYYTVCNHRAPKKGWENLAEKPITGIATLPGGGLVTGSFLGKSLEEKGFVPNVGRSTDPDTFSDPDSARIRARNLGCIGIRRYSARDGKLVWLPCTNVSDYNRLIGVRGDNSLRNNPRQQGSKYRKKILGTPIGGVAEHDGDRDGMRTGPDGEDNVPVAPKKIIDRFKSSVESRWGSDRYEGEKMFIEPKWKIDEMPALKDVPTKALLKLADRLNPPHYSLESIDEIRRRQGTDYLRFKPMPQDDRNAIVHALVAHLMKKWENDAQNDVSKLMHKAVADEFELDKVNKVLSSNNSFGLSAEDESTLGAVVRAMYQRTQLHLEDTGMKKDDKVGLSRAIEGNSDLRNQIGNRVSFKTNPLTSFTHDTDVADEWGRHHIVLKGGIPSSQIFFINNVMLQGGNNDVAEEFEVIVLGGELDVKVAKPNKSDGDL